MTMRVHLIWRVAVVVLVLSEAFVHAQDTVSVTGTVRDASGAIIANAQVTVSSAERGIKRETTTNSDGEYSVPALPVPASYNVTVATQGFKTYQAKGVILRVGQKARNDVTLQVGAAGTAITVQGTAVGQVETQSNELAGKITGKEICQLQLNGRGFTQLLTLTPGGGDRTGSSEDVFGIYV